MPTILDMPPMRIEVLEYADPHAPYGVRGVGEPPTISSGPAVAAAVRAACGRPLRRGTPPPQPITRARAGGGAARPAAGGGNPRTPQGGGPVVTARAGMGGPGAPPPQGGLPTLP